MAQVYWRLWWRWHDFREARFARAVARHMQRDAMVFVHPNGESAAKLVIVHLDGRVISDPMMDIVMSPDLPHGHVEGKARP